MEDALDRKRLVEREMLATYSHSGLGEVTTIGLPVKMTGYQPPYRQGPLLDGDRRPVLREIGYSDHEIDELEQRGAFGEPPNPTVPRTGRGRLRSEGAA
jgi:crotonobetainyl-CoA:carnitine CoA-transferase CaiB-like acyl-CoA transferase